jgi:exodeoxyribonuclease VII large subunit
MQQQLQNKQQKIDWLSKRIRHPKDQLQIITNKLNELSQRNIRNMENKLLQLRSKNNLLEARLQQYAPLQRIQQLQMQHKNIHSRFQLAAQKMISIKKEKMQHLIFTLDALSPLHTLQRGYAIIKDENNNIIRNVHDVKKDQQIKTELAKGSIISTITDINND